MTDVNNMKVVELKHHLKNYGLKIKGNRAELWKRLVNHLNTNVTDHATDSAPSKSDIAPPPKTEKTLKVSDFNLYVNEYEEFKRFMTGKLANIYELLQEKQTALGRMKDLEKENEFLKSELKSKQALVEILHDDIRNKQNNNRWLTPNKTAKAATINK